VIISRGLMVHHKSMSSIRFAERGTTIVECKKLGLPSISMEAHLMGRFTLVTQIDWAR
jgi:hypothetical protein